MTAIDFVRNPNGSIKEATDSDRPSNLFVRAAAEINGARKEFTISAPFPKDYPYEARKRQWQSLAEAFVDAHSEGKK